MYTVVLQRTYIKRVKLKVALIYVIYFTLLYFKNLPPVFTNAVPMLYS